MRTTHRGPRVTRRTALAIAGGVVFAGWGRAASGDASPKAARTPRAPKRGGTLAVAIDAESSGFNPHVDAWSHDGHIVGRAIFDTLAAPDANGRPQPNLAESITVNHDATVWTITVRDGITFHDGTPLDAAAVKSNFDAALASPTMAADLGRIQSVTVVADLTVEVAMSEPWGTFPNSLIGGFGSQLGYMAAPAMLEDPDGMRHPIGTGSFVFAEWKLDDRLSVVRNDRYWRGPVHLDEIVFRPLISADTRLAAFEAGDIDVLYTGNAPTIVDFLRRQDDGGAQVVVGAPSDPEVIILNTLQPPLDDRRVRRALAMALDIDRLIAFNDGTGVNEPMRGPYAEQSFWYVKTDYPTHDPDEARALIDEYTNDVGPVEFEYGGNQSANVVAYQELVQSMWAEIGVTANIVSKAQSENIAAVFNRDFAVMGWGGIGGGDPDNDFRYFHSGDLNITGFNTPEIDAAMENGRALADRASRREQYATVQRELAAEMPYLWLNLNQWAIIGQGDVHGLDGATLPDGTPAQPLVEPRVAFGNVWLATD